VPTHQFSEHFQYGAFVSSLCNDTLKNLAFVIGGPPQIVAITANLHEDLVDVPLPSGEGARLLAPSAPDFRRKYRPKPVPQMRTVS